MGDSANNKEDEDRLQLKSIVSFLLKVIRMVAFVVAECDVGSNEAVRDYDIGCTTVCEKLFQRANFRNMGMGGSGKISVVSNIICCSNMFDERQEIWEGRLQINNLLTFLCCHSERLTIINHNR